MLVKFFFLRQAASDYQALDVEREWYDLQNALQPLVKCGSVVVERLESASLLALQRQLRRSEYHIFHFIGHGIFDERKQDGLLLFTNEQGRGRSLSGQDLGTLLHDHRSLRLAVLNACEGARTGKEDPFAGVAHSLVQMGLPAVIAMQFEISDSAAILFAQEFYTALADGYGVDAALGDARKALFASGDSVEWGTPVLFSRTLDGRIFDWVSGPTSVATQSIISSDAVREPSQPFISEVAALYEDGLTACQLEDWVWARDTFQTVVKSRPDYRDAADRLKQAQQQIDLAQRYQQIQKLLEISDWRGALEILDKLSNEAPNYRDTTQLLQQVRQQVRLLALYAAATRQSQAGEWRAVVSSFSQIAKLQPDYPDPQNLLSNARTQLALFDLNEKLNHLYLGALQAMKAQRWIAARQLLEQIQKIEPSYRDVAQLYEKTQSVITHQKLVNKTQIILFGIVVVAILVVFFKLFVMPAITLVTITPTITPTVKVTAKVTAVPKIGTIQVEGVEGIAEVSSPDKTWKKLDAKAASIDLYDGMILRTANGKMKIKRGGVALVFDNETSLQMGAETVGLLEFTLERGRLLVIGDQSSVKLLNQAIEIRSVDPKNEIGIELDTTGSTGRVDCLNGTCEIIYVKKVILSAGQAVQYRNGKLDESLAQYGPWLKLLPYYAVVTPSPTPTITPSPTATLTPTMTATR